MEEYGFSKDLSRDELAVANTQGIIFEECQALGVDAVDYITKFMHSETAENLDVMKQGVFSAGSAQLKRYALEQIKPVKHFETASHVNEEALYWVGYIYRYWSYLLGTHSRDIIRTVPVEKALLCYPAYHCMGNKEAISKMVRSLFEAARQNGR